MNAVEFEGRERVQVGEQTLTPIAEIRLDLEDPFFTNLRDLLQQPDGAAFLQSTGNTLDRPEVRQFIRDEFPELDARELFGGFAAGAVGEGGFTQGNVQQRQQLLFSQLQSRNAGGSEREVPVTFDSAGNLIDAQETLPGSEAGVQAAAEAAAEAAEAAAAVAESVQMRIAAEMLYSETVQGIYNSVAEAFEAAEERKTEIIQRAAEQRVIADMRLAETQQDIYNDVVDAHETSEERKTDISERATEQRGDAEQIYVDTVQGIYNSVAEAFEAAEERKTEITQRAIEQRADADTRLGETQQGIYNSVADAFEDAEERKTDIAERAAEQRADVDAAPRGYPAGHIQLCSRCVPSVTRPDHGDFRTCS